MGFIGSKAVAAKSCSWGAVVAFAPGGFHGIDGGGSKILLPEALLLPLTLVCFFGSKAVAAKSCSWGAVVAFDLGEFHRVQGGGSKILASVTNFSPYKKAAATLRQPLTTYSFNLRDFEQLRSQSYSIPRTL